MLCFTPWTQHWFSFNTKLVRLSVSNVLKRLNITISHDELQLMKEAMALMVSMIILTVQWLSKLVILKSSGIYLVWYEFSS